MFSTKMDGLRSNAESAQGAYGNQTGRKVAAGMIWPVWRFGADDALNSEIGNSLTSL